MILSHCKTTLVLAVCLAIASSSAVADTNENPIDPGSLPTMQPTLQIQTTTRESTVFSSDSESLIFSPSVRSGDQTSSLQGAVC